jgi:hypothetical protein
VGNRRAREFRLEQDRLARLAEEERTRTQPRPASGHRHLMGIGSLRLQIIVLPSFEEPRAWEVRQRQQQWILFRSRVVEPGPEARLAGYEPVSFESVRLQEFFRRVTALTLPHGPDLDGFGGADGSLYQHAVFGDDYAEFRFQWWSVPPPPWQPLVNVANEMIKAFLMAEGWRAEDRAGWPE